MQHSTFVIKPLYGGLGDLLFYSHLPRIAHELGYEKVLISNKCEHRHEKYKKLIWDLNPYVNGYTDADTDYPPFKTIPAGMNILDKLMLDSGLDDGKRFHEPEVYYKPNLLPEFADKVVYDGNYISATGRINPKLILKILKQKSNIIQMTPLPGGIPLQDVDSFETTSIYQYCDIIHSCKEFYCLTSGGAVLAAALGKSANVFYGTKLNPMFLHSKLNTYIKVSDPEPIRIIKKLFKRKRKV